MDSAHERNTIFVQIMAQPVFIIGRNRSGTKWLSNLVSNHSEVAAVTNEKFAGILETNMFVQFPKAFGTLKIEDSYFAFVSCYQHTNFFKFTGLSQDILYQEPRILDYFEFFRFIMDAFAKSQNKSFWLQKSATYNLKALVKAYPDAKFIIIQRNLADNLRSSIGLRRNRKNEPVATTIEQEIFGYYYSIKTDRKYLGLKNVTLVKYEDLKKDRVSVLQEVCRFLSLSFEPGMENDRFKKNTSFGSEERRNAFFDWKDELKIKVLSPIIRLMPYALMHWIWIRKNPPIKKREFNKRHFIPGTFTEQFAIPNL
jgi:hypothetical protein